MPPTQLYKLINNLNKMNRTTPATHYTAASSRSAIFGGAAQCSSPSILLPKIHDQQFYLCLTSTLLRLASQAGVRSPLLREVGDSLLAARGLNSERMLKNGDGLQEDEGKQRQSYDWLQRSCSTQEQMQFLEKIEQELGRAREKQSQYYCLKKYIRQKEEEIAPVGTCSPTSRKQRFRRMLQHKNSSRNVESSNFYKFQVAQILENSFKSQNQCYRTMNSFVRLKTMFGHSADEDLQSYSQIYNAIYDRSENLIISAGEEGTVKVWHKNTGALIRNLKGHTDFINKIDTSKCNKYLLTTGGDGIRFFDLRSLRPLGGWKADSIADITSFREKDSNIFVFGDKCQLYLLTEDVMLAKSSSQLAVQDFFIFQFSQLIRRDNGPVLVITISPQRTHLILGLQKGQFILVKISDLLQEMKINQRGRAISLPALSVNHAHYDQIIQVKWSESSSMWATGSKDGRCCLWEYRGQQAYLLHTLAVNRGNKGRKKRLFSCTYICWNCVFSHFAAGFQESIDEEDSERGQGEVLVYSIKQQKVTCELSQDISLKFGGIRAMDAHPYYPNILLICEAEGHIILFDLFLVCIVNVFQQRGYHILHPQFSLIPTECRFSQDGLTLIVGSEYGSVSLYGYDSKPFYQLCPSEQFLATDFKEFAIDDDSMKAVALTLDFDGDINDYPRGDVLNIRGQPHEHMINLNPSILLFYLNNQLEVSLHSPEIAIEPCFLQMIDHNLRQVALQDQSYNKTYQEIESNRLVILFHQRERQYASVRSLTTHKLQQFNSAHQYNSNTQAFDEPPPAQEPSRITRNLKRMAQRQRINYADNYSQNQNIQEFNSDQEEVLEEDLPEEVSESSSDSQNFASRRLDRTRNRILRNTRHNNNVSYLEEQIEQPHRVAHRRHRDLDHELLDQENQPHKRIKMSEQLHSQQDEPKKFSRLRKHAEQSQMMQQQNDCYRCQMVKSTQFCHRCKYTQQYCLQCSQMRGRVVKDKYKCVICLFLSNQAEQQYDHLNENLYRQTKRSFDTFVPQIGDRLRFFFQGYQQFLVQNVQKLNNQIVQQNSAFRILPQTENAFLLGSPLCEVVSTDFYFPIKSDLSSSSKRTPGKLQPSPILMLVGLKPIGGIEQQNTEDSTFWVYYIPGQQFLVPESIYAQIAEKDIMSKIQLFDLIQVKDEEMQIVEIGPFEDRYPESFWKMMKIRKTQGKRLRGNTKEIEKKMNIWKISQDIDLERFNCTLQSATTQRLIRHLQNWIKQNSPYCLFVDYVDFEIYPEYRRQIPVGICLQVILQRLKNSYYVGEDSLNKDINMLMQNSLRFNGPQHVVTKTAEQLVGKLLALVKSDQIPRQSNSHSKREEKEQEDSTNKKKKNAEDRVYNSRETFKLIKNQHLRKRKESSSDYEQNSGSASAQVRIATRGTRIKHSQEVETKRITRSRTHRT